MGNGGAIVIDLDLMTDAFQTGIRSAERMVSSFSDNVSRQNSKLMSSFKNLGRTIIAAFSLRAITQFTKSCIELGSDLAEIQNVVDVTFGNSASTIDSWAKSVQASFGLSELSAKQYAGTMGAMLKSSGLAGEAVTDMSMRISELAGDMASFYNLSTDEAFQKIRSGISGETEPLKVLGINLSVANLEAFALAKGINKSYKEMSQAEQVLLRYNYLMEQTADAQGDFARTSDSWANQVRILQLRFESLKATLGQGFINILTPLIQKVNVLMGYLQNMADAFLAFTSAIFGSQKTTTSTTGAVSEDMSGIAGDATTAAAALDKMTSSFDELHKVSSGTAGGAGASGLVSGITTETNTETGEDGVMNKFQESIDKFMNSKTVKMFTRMWSTIKSLVLEIANSFKTMWNNGWNEKISKRITEFIQTVIGGVSKIAFKIKQALKEGSGKYAEIDGVYRELTIGEYLADTFFNLVDAVTELATVISEKLLTAIKDIDWAEVLKEWGKLLEDIVTLVRKLSGAIDGGETEGLSGALTIILKYLPHIWLMSKAFSAIGTIVNTIAGLSAWSSISGAIGAIGLSFGSAAILAGAFAVGIYAVIKIVENLIGFFKTLDQLLELVINKMLHAIGYGTELKESMSGDWHSGGSRSRNTGGSKSRVPALANGGYVGPNTPRLVQIGDNKRYGEVVANTKQLND